MPNNSLKTQVERILETSRALNCIWNDIPEVFKTELVKTLTDLAEIVDEEVFIRGQESVHP